MEKKRVILLVISFVLIIGCIATIVYILRDGHFDSSKYKNVIESEPESVVSQEEQVLVENPINFSELKTANSDIYAWITIPNTNVDYPILQPTGDEDVDFYLDHNSEKKYSKAGAIYTHPINSTDFSDSNTVIYGHNMLNRTMFRTLHNFQNSTFFQNNEYMYIYTPGHILTYRIFAAYEYDDRLILTSYNFNDPAEINNYFQTCLNPTRAIRNVREGVTLNENDKIVTLSTCISKEGSRYLVQGVLIQDELTK